MKAHLMYRDRDFDLERKPPAHAPALLQDLALPVLAQAMAGGDEFLLHVAQQALVSGLQDDLPTVLYRQAVLQDCLRQHAVVQALYDLAVETMEEKKRQWFGIFGSYPGSILFGAVELLQMFITKLGKLRRIAGEHAASFESEGFRNFFAVIEAELADDYFARLKEHLRELRFHDGVLLSAELGPGNQGTGYVLRRSTAPRPNWFQRLFTRPPGFTFHIPERDEAGFKALSELHDRGINQVANAAAQSADHILSFFVLLRTELAFYLGCVNLHRTLAQKGVPVCFPVPAPFGARAQQCAGLRDVCLALRLDHAVVGNDLAADGKNLVIITGANQGGKSTFLRAIGLAQVMMQCGMFVAAESFRADVCRGLFTHYKREEDATMKSGKFDEELRRMSALADTLAPDALVLFNESFAATNEREGSEIARQIVQALLEARVKIFFVTHQYEFAHGWFAQQRADALFLRAERQPDGTRTFKLQPGEPLQTSFGVDLYAEVFAGASR
jgi:ABC-type histidine transport system ATPase subunit